MGPQRGQQRHHGRPGPAQGVAYGSAGLCGTLRVTHDITVREMTPSTTAVVDRTVALTVIKPAETKRYKASNT